MYLPGTSPLVYATQTSRGEVGSYALINQEYSTSAQ